jgi:hypothetical protein
MITTISPVTGEHIYPFFWDPTADTGQAAHAVQNRGYSADHTLSGDIIPKNPYTGVHHIDLLRNPGKLLEHVPAEAPVLAFLNGSWGRIEDMKAAVAANRPAVITIIAKNPLGHEQVPGYWLAAAIPLPPKAHQHGTPHGLSFSREGKLTVHISNSFANPNKRSAEDADDGQPYKRAKRTTAPAVRPPTQAEHEAQMAQVVSDAMKSAVQTPQVRTALERQNEHVQQDEPMPPAVNAREEPEQQLHQCHHTSQLAMVVYAPPEQSHAPLQQGRASPEQSDPRSREPTMSPSPEVIYVNAVTCDPIPPPPTDRGYSCIVS